MLSDFLVGSRIASLVVQPQVTYVHTLIIQSTSQQLLDVTEADYVVRATEQALP